MVQPIGPVQPIILAPIQPIASVNAVLIETPPTGEPVAPPPPQPHPSTQAVAAAVAQAAGRQGGLAPLMANLAQAAPALPADAQAAARQVLALQTPLSAQVAGPELKQAVAQSGLFLEARLAAAPQTPPGPDLKAALLVLREVLTTAAAGQPVTRPPPGYEGLPPPYRGAPMRAQRPAAPSLPTGTRGGDLAARLLQQTDAALAREELLQAASLPGGRPGPDEAEHPASARWMFDIPFATPQGPAVAQFEISRDAPRPGETAAESEAAAWRARFSVDLEPFGPVHAALALTGERIGVTLWAERPDSALALRARREELGRALLLAAPSVDVAIHAGAPTLTAPANGRLVDQAS